MLRFLELHDDADKLSDALYGALTEQKTHTPDIGVSKCAKIGAHSLEGLWFESNDSNLALF